MRKAIVGTILMLALLFTAFPAAIFAFAISSDNAVIVMSGAIKENDGEISVSANLIKNDGISAMDIELVYDDSALTLIGIDKGNTLASLALDPWHTNTETDKGYSIRPFKFNYSGDKNDYSTGNLFTLLFKVKEDAKSGTYKISLRYERDKSVNYFENGDVKTRNLSVDSVEIKTQGSVPMKISTVSDTEDGSVNIPLIVSGAVFAAASVTALTVFATHKRKRWKKV